MDLRAKRAEIDAAIAVLERVRGMNGSAPVSASEPVIEKTAAKPGAFFGMSLKEACIAQLSRFNREPQTARELWAALEAAGFQSAHSDPTHAIFTALTKRSRSQKDVFLAGRGKWALKAWYSDAEIEKIEAERDGMPGRDHAAHVEKTSVECAWRGRAVSGSAQR